jgi:DNA-binding NarL/FixJ family response regulator
MTAPSPLVLPLADPGDPADPGGPVRYVTIDDEPRYRMGLGAPAALVAELGLEQVGSYPDVEAFLAVHRQPCHVLVLDLCLNRRTGDTAVLHGVRAIRLLAGELGHRVVVHTADARPEPVARCVAAGAVGYVSKYDDDPAALARAVVEVATHGRVCGLRFTGALLALVRQCHDVRLSGTLEETLVLLDRGLTDAEVARRRQLSARTVEDHKRKILEIFGTAMEQRRQGFAGLAKELGVGPGDIVNDRAGGRPARGLIQRAVAWARPGRHPRP